MFFETYFNLWGEQGVHGEVLVNCPIPHHKKDGTTYMDHNPSCSINLEKRLWNCKSCGCGGNEVQMIEQIFHCTSSRARKFLDMLRRGFSCEHIHEQLKDYTLTEECKRHANSIGIFDPNVLTDLDVMVEKIDDHFEYSLPVYYMGRVVDIRTYRPGCQPKVLSLPGAPSGLIVPYDKLMESDDRRWVILNAGEKDMMVARCLGLNAYTLTGGETNSVLNPEWFARKKVAICYDNDDAGRTGALKIARQIYPYVSCVRIVNRFHEAFNGDDTKEDFTDWVLKYGGSKEQFIEDVNNTPDFVPDETDDNVTNYRVITLAEAIDPKYHGQILRSTVQILTTSDTPFEIPSTARVKKVAALKGMLNKGDSVQWNLNDHPDSVFLLTGANKARTEDVIRNNMRLGNEKGVVVDVFEREVVWVCQVADVGAGYEDMSELTVYCVGCHPAQGKKYTLTYLRSTDTARGTVALIADQMEDALDDISTFTINEDTKASLVYGLHTEGDVADRVSRRATAVRGLLGYECDETLITLIDLTFNTVEAFNYGNNKNVRGYMDNLVIGESRIGKSDTAKHLRDVYNIGAFVSLAGTSSTIAGIVGGTVKDGVGRNSTRAGVIPRNHKSIIVFEELAKAKEDISRSLTDVRSSGVARITRVNGSVEMPASLRMLTLSNPRCLPTGESRPISEYSNGLEITRELIGASEDIARYDLILISEGGNTETDPLYDAPEPFPDKVLQDLVRWVWSRKPDDIKFLNGSDVMIRDKAKELNETYPMHIKLFGTECWKKLARLSIATAAYVVSTDDTFESICVYPEHVDWAYNFMIKIYDNETFKIRSIVADYIAKTTPDERSTARLQEMYIQHRRVIDRLYTQSKMDKKTFRELSGLDDNACGPLIRTLIARDFVNSERDMLYVTMKFKKTYKLLDQHTEVARV